MISDRNVLYLDCGENIIVIMLVVKEKLVQLFRLLL